MTTNFLPDYGFLSIAGGHVIGLFRLYDTQSWQQVLHPKTGKPILYPSAHEALKASKAVVKSILNEEVRSAVAEASAPSDDPDILALESWRKQKQEEYAKARATVKNGKNRRKFVVERRERKVRAK